MLCDSCQKREATVHNTIMVGGVLNKSDLCDECFKTSPLGGAGALAATLKAGCRYCSREPFTGSGSGQAQTAIGTGLGVGKLGLMCERCAKEYLRFLEVKMPGFGSGTLTKKQITELAKQDFAAISAEVEAHMKVWVAARN